MKIADSHNTRTAWSSPKFDVSKGNQRLKAVLAERAMTIVDLSRLAGVPYYVLLRAILGYAKASNRLRESTSEVLGMAADQLWGSEER